MPIFVKIKNIVMKHLIILFCVGFFIQGANAQNQASEKCKSLFKNQKYEKCIKKAENYLDKDRTLGELYYLKGFSHFGLYQNTQELLHLNNALREVSRGTEDYNSYKKNYAQELAHMKTACKQIADSFYSADKKKVSEKYYKYLAEIYQDTTKQYKELFIYSERPDGEIIRLTEAGEINQTDEKGRKQGLWRKVYPNGVTAYEVQFKDDKPVGTMLRYHPNSRKMAELKFNEDGSYAKAKLYDEQESLIAKGFYAGEKKDSLWKYYKNDFLVQTENYNQAVLHGEMKAYYPNGQVYDLRQMENGKENGVWEKFYQNGEPMLKGVVKDDKLEGSFLRYFPDGSIEEKGQYKNDLKTGEWEYYTEDGKKHTITYKNGKAENADETELKQSEKYQKQIENRLKDPENFKNRPYEYIND
jgi:antitoxin component YwqK of YwqJK toxin-antitoxin module